MVDLKSLKGYISYHVEKAPSLSPQGFFLVDLERAVVVITGASSGLGKEIALSLSHRNLRMVITGRDEARLKEVARECSAPAKAAIHTFIGDLTAEATCKELIDFCKQTFGALDCLILNAGVNAHFEFEDLKDVSVFEKLMRVNFYANVYLTRDALPLLKRSGGNIVVISSLSGKFGLPSRSAYCASKFALTGFFESLRTELELPIMIVYPTSLETPMRQNSLIRGASEKQERREDPKKCAELIVKGLDTGKDDIYLPLKGRLGVILQPMFPRFIREKLKAAAKL